MSPAPSFARALINATGAPLRAASISTVQVNVGLACNLACVHCHVESGPKRTEAMSRETMAQVLAVVRASGASVVDVTGGAPEMHPEFRWFVDAALGTGARVMVRTNLTILLEPGFTDLPEWFAARGVHLVASLPCYTPDNVDAQRGARSTTPAMEGSRRCRSTWSTTPAAPDCRVRRRRSRPTTGSGWPTTSASRSPGS